MSSTSITCTPYYCPLTSSPSIKLSITYPNDIPNLAYNFTLTIIVNKQTLFPKITYTQVHQQTIYVPKKQIILNQLSPKTMYQVVMRFGFHNRKNSNNILQVNNQREVNNDCEEKIVFVFTQGVPDEGQNEQQQSLPSSYSEVVRQNIKDYFHQYHPSENHRNYYQSSSQSNNSNNNHPSSPSFNQSIRSTSTRNNPLCNSQTMMKVIGENDPLINKKKLQKYILQGRKSSSVNDYLKTNNYLCFNSMNKVYKNQKHRRQHMQKALLVTKTINMFGEIYQSGDIQDDGGNNKQRGEFFKNEWFMGPFYSYNENEKQMKSKKITRQQQQ